jgi:HAD superfamily hydrolase (TIGR01549 family)
VLPSPIGYSARVTHDHDLDTAVFDVDGTLVDTNYQHAIAWFRAFRRYGITVPVWRLHRAIGMGGDQLVAAVTDDDVETNHGDDLRDAWAKEFAPMLEEVRAFAGVEALLSEVRERGFRIALASSGKQEHVEHYLSLFNGKELADAWTTSDDVAKSKPEPDIVATALAKVEGASGIMVGDSIFDAQAGGQAQDPHARGPHRRFLGRGAAGGGGPAGLRLAGGLPPGPERHPPGPRQPLSARPPPRGRQIPS